MQTHYMALWVPAFSASVENEQAAKSSPPFTAFQFATVGEDGYPSNRTVVFRGFLFGLPSNSVLTFSTDRRMAKYRELLHNDRFEAVFYFASVRRQFRFRGRARVLDQSTTPVCVCDISSRAIGHLSSDELEGEDGDELEIAVSARHVPSSTPQLALNYPVFSPLATAHFGNALVEHLADLAKFAPSAEDWLQEIRRQWEALSPGLQLSYRRPAPKTSLLELNQKLIDKINRGVDGKKADLGLENFAVVALFVELVDYYEMEKDRRYLFTKDADHIWSEHEVCP